MHVHGPYHIIGLNLKYNTIVLSYSSFRLCVCVLSRASCTASCTGENVLIVDFKVNLLIKSLHQKNYHYVHCTGLSFTLGEAQ